MSELRVIDGDLPETLTEVVAKRLRGQLAERNIKRKDVMELTGWGKTTVYRKVSGQSPLDTDELDQLWRLFKISPVFLLTGVPDDRPWPGPDGSPNGGAGAPTRARTWDLRIIRPKHGDEVRDIPHWTGQDVA